MKTYSPELLLDGYKLGHKDQYPKGTQKVYSTWTPRGSRVEGQDTVVCFGLQMFIKKWLIDYYNDNFFNADLEAIVKNYKRFMKAYLGNEDADTSHISELHELGYLPIKICALEEGTKVPMRVPMLSIENTLPQFYWLTNYLETLMSSELWYTMTCANTSLMYKEIADKFALETVGNADFSIFQCHDFSQRGQHCTESAILCGIAHMLSFVGTDVVPAILATEHYYNTNIEKDLIGCSVNATEHAVMEAGGKVDEYETYKRLITEIYPNGIVSIVSDTWDYFSVLTNILPKLKDTIMSRDGKVVIRPDSGNPFNIICGHDYIEGEEGYQNCSYLNDIANINKAQLQNKLVKIEDKFYTIEGVYPHFTKGKEISESVVKGSIQLLWEVFGGNVNDLGYKILDSHIGLIYGEAIQPELMTRILQKLKEQGFASTNVLFGVGSYGFLSAGVQGGIATRDSYGFAMKAVYAVINGEEKFIFKNPITDSGLKKSQRGMVAVYKENGKLTYKDGLGRMEKKYMQEVDLLKPVFEDGKLLKDFTLQEIRDNVRK